MASGTQRHPCSLLLFSSPVPLSVLFSIQTYIETLQKTITYLSYSNWNAKIIWFALLAYCITCDKCCEDQKERIETGAHDVGSDWDSWVCLFQRRKDKGRFNCYPPQREEYENLNSSQDDTMKRRGDSHKLQGNFNWIWEEKFTMRVVQCKNRLHRESGYLCSWSFSNFSWEYLCGTCSDTEVGCTLSRSWTKPFKQFL